MAKINSEWILCPICGNKTRLQIREDTELKNFLIYCLKSSATERSTHANDRYLYKITSHPIIKTAVKS